MRLEEVEQFIEEIIEDPRYLDQISTEVLEELRYIIEWKVLDRDVTENNYDEEW
jgi:hypothetical protein